MKRYSPLKRTRFERKKYDWRKTSAQHGGSTLKRTRLRAKGKKVIAWDRERRILKLDSIKHDRTTCELRGVIQHDCTYDDYLGYAHPAKRRKLSAEDLKVAILICNNAHNVIEFWKPEDMERIVMEVIANREVSESLAA